MRPLGTLLALLPLALAACGDLRPETAAGALASTQRPGAAPTRQPVPKTIDPRGTAGAATKQAPAQPAGPAGRKEDGVLAGITAAHNQVRAGVGQAPLAWDEAIGGFAQEWADHLAANSCQLAHRPAATQKYGENVYWSSGQSNAAGVVASWAAEEADYNPATNACSGVCGHYTQIVWSATTALGCGQATCPGGGRIWVCNYDPRGNVMGQKPY